MMYGEDMNGTDNHIDALATTGQLRLFTIISVICLLLLLAGTSWGNNDFWDKLFNEIDAGWNLLCKASWASIGWIPALYYHMQAKNLGVTCTYDGRHRLA